MRVTIKGMSLSVLGQRHRRGRRVGKVETSANEKLGGIFQLAFSLENSFFLYFPYPPNSILLLSAPPISHHQRSPRLDQEWSGHLTLIS